MQKLFFLIFVLIASIQHSFAADETIIHNYVRIEPQSFRGISWGQSIFETANLQSIGSLSFSKHTDFFESLGEHPVFYYLKNWSGEGYINENDKLKIGYADVNEILYLFRNGRFYGTVVESLGITNRNELQKAVNAWMGNHTSEIKTSGKHTIIWEGNKVRAVLDYNRTVFASKRDIKLYIISKDMEADFIGF